MFKRPVLGGIIDTDHLPPPAGALRQSLLSPVTSRNSVVTSFKQTETFEKLKKQEKLTKNNVIKASLSVAKRKSESKIY